MLEKLIIRNYALIDEVNLDFSNGLSIITGETGAGKSVMMGALGMLTGDRADSKMLTRQEKATIEAWFDNVAPGLKLLFEYLDLDWNEGQVIVRREISPNGRSRAFVNDTPVTLPVLGQITEQLIDIHSQNTNRLLSDPDHQRRILDLMAGNTKLLTEYKTHFRRYVELRSRIRKIRENRERSRENREMIEYQLEQLDALRLKPGELTDIERRFELLSDADDLREKLSEAYAVLDGEETGARSMVWEAKNLVAAFPEIQERLESLYVELSDIASTVEDELGSIESDPMELNRLTNRMHELYEAERRFKVSGCEGLIELRESLREQLDSVSGDPEELSGLEEEARELARLLKEEAARLTETRQKAADKFSEKISRDSKPLGLKNIRFEVRLTQGKMTSEGQDTVEYYCCFNKNQEPMPMAKVASGGEMSRLTLTIKGLLADKLKLPTVIFDEIDTGVSGEIADRMGEMMARIASDMQVVAITHLPQVAAKGANHFLVYKKDLADRTVSNVKPLVGEERVREIARMLSGRRLNEAAIENARALLSAL